MSTSQHVATASTYDHGAQALARGRRGRVTIIAAALALGASTVAAMLLWNPWPARDELSYGAVAPVRDNTWLGMTLDGLGLAVASVALSLAVCLLARQRGAVWATVGSILTSIGGLLFAMGAFAFAAFSYYATQTDAISRSAGTELMNFAEDNPAHMMGLQMAGFLLFTVGVVSLSIGLLRAGTVPRWAPVALLVLTVAQFAPIPGRALDMVQVAFMTVMIALAALILRAEPQFR